MQITGNVEFSCNVRLHADEAKVLHLLCSYDLLKWFRENCNHSELGLTADQMQDIVRDMRGEFAQFLELNDQAHALLNPKGRKSK